MKNAFANVQIAKTEIVTIVLVKIAHATIVIVK